MLAGFGGQHAWGAPYSLDLRQRVVAAVESGGMSRNRAAAHFGVAISTAINWVKAFRQTGSLAPGRMGGHRPKKIAGEHRDWLIARCRTADFTLRGLVAELGERGLKVDYRSVWEFVHAEKLSFKKNAARQRTGSTRRRPSTRAMATLSGTD
jgi:putative transposase